MDIVVLSIIYFILLLGVTGVLIYLIVDFSKYKEKDANALQQTLSQVEAESNERKSNVNYVIQEANKMNKGMYDELNTNIKDTKSEIQYSLDRFGRAIKLVDPTVGTNTSTGVSTGSVGTNMPSTATPDIQLVSKVTALSGMDVKDIAKVDKLQLGDKFQFSGVGDASANDDWLRMFNKEGKGYYGGIAMSKLWVGGPSYLRGDTNFKGGASEHNPGNWGTHLPWHGNNKNYIRGDTEIRGNTNNIGDVKVGRNMNVQGRLHFGDPNMTVAGSSANNTDSYHMEKKVYGANNSELRITVNDDAGESLTIRGGSCAAGNCAGDGVVKHRFDGAGNAAHSGWTTTNGLTTTNNLHITAGKTITSDGRMHIHGPELLYMLNKNGVIIGKEWGGNGSLQVQGPLSVGENATVSRHVDARSDWGGKGSTLFAGWHNRKTILGNWRSNGHDYALARPAETVVVTNPLHVQNQLCVGDVCITPDDLTRIKARTA